MAKQGHKQKPEETKTEEAEEAKGLQGKGEELKNTMDDLIDEIDDVLEENAEEFVKQYVQRGGE